MNQSTENQSPSAVPAAEQLGLRLRQAREAKRISIGEVAEYLKLTARQIEALESGHYQHLPEWVFVRGFLRTYSRFLDLDEQETADMLVCIASEGEEKKHAVVQRAAPQHELNYQGQKVKKPFPNWIFFLLLISAATLSIWAWQSKSHAENRRHEAETVSRPVLADMAAAGSQADNVAVVAMNAQSPEQQEAAAIHSAQTAVVAPTAENNTALAADELRIVIRYRSMLAVKDKNGHELIKKIVPAKSEYRFQGGAPYDVWIGYALGAKVDYGSRSYHVPQYMVDKKSASLRVGER